jgi:hypothetical protein
MSGFRQTFFVKHIDVLNDVTSFRRLGSEFMRRIFLVGIIFIFLLAAGCNRTTQSVSETSDPINSTSTTSIQQLDVVDGYLLVVDYLLNNGEAIVEQDKYLALDTSKMVNLSLDDKTRLLQDLEAYGLQVLNKTRAELEQEGYIVGTNFEHGILIEIKDMRMEANTITMDASRYRGGVFAFGMEDFRIRYVSGRWEITDIDITWVA